MQLRVQCIKETCTLRPINERGDRENVEQLSKRVLVVEDDIDTLQLIVDVLADEGLQVQPCSDGEQAQRLLEREAFDLVLADIKMPRVTGTDLLFFIRHLNLKTRVILMTAYASVDTAVQAVRGDAYDYLMKPFALRELRERVHGALQSPAPEELPRGAKIYKGLMLDTDAHKVWLDGQEVALTRLEYKTLAYLFEWQGRTVPIEELFQHVWECANPEQQNLNAVKSCVFRLRKKLGDDPHQPQHIRNVWGVGYQLGE
jgi:DNA-binding response OmpR family regulator